MTSKLIIGSITMTGLIAWMGGNLFTFGIVMLVVGVFLAKCWQSGKSTIKNRGKVGI